MCARTRTPTISAPSTPTTKTFTPPQSASREMAATESALIIRSAYRFSLGTGQPAGCPVPSSSPTGQGKVLIEDMPLVWQRQCRCGGQPWLDPQPSPHEQHE